MQSQGAIGQECGSPWRPRRYSRRRIRLRSGTLPPAVLSISPDSEQPKSPRPPGVVRGRTTLPPTRYVSVTYPQMHTLTAEEVDHSEDENDTAALELGTACLTRSPACRRHSTWGSLTPAGCRSQCCSEHTRGFDVLGQPCQRCPISGGISYESSTLPYRDVGDYCLHAG